MKAVYPRNLSSDSFSISPTSFSLLPYLSVFFQVFSGMSVPGNPKLGIVPLERVRDIVAFSDDVAKSYTLLSPPAACLPSPSWTSRGTPQAQDFRPNNPPPTTPFLSLIGLVSQPHSRTTDLLPTTTWILDRHPDTLVTSFGIASWELPSATTSHRENMMTTIDKRRISSEYRYPYSFDSKIDTMDSFYCFAKDI